MASGEGRTPQATDRIVAAVIAAVLLGLYAAGASRTIYVGDSGELVTAVDLLGIPHPSGYPLYVLLGKLWTLVLPLGSVAFRMSLFSASCAAAASGILYLLSRAMRLGRAASLLAALLLAFSPSFWSQANIQRVYALNALFLAMASWAAWRWHERLSSGPAAGERGSNPDRWLLAAFFLCGLGATNHLFMGPVAVCLGVFAVLRFPPLLMQPRLLLLSAAAFGAGLLPYLYLPLRSRMDPRLDWGNPETLQGFMDVVFREDFWGRAWIEGPMDLFPIAADYLHGLGSELAWGGALLALAGLLAWRRLGAFTLVPVMVMAANLASMALHGSRVDLFIWHRYYIPSYLMAALLAGAGWDLIAGREGAPPEHVREAGSGTPVSDMSAHGSSRTRAGGAGLVRSAVPWIALALPAGLLVTGWSRFDRSRYQVSEAFSRTVLESLPPGAHLIATDDNILFTSMYLHLVEGMRPDVNLILQGVGGAQLPPLKFNPDEDPVYFTHHPNWNLAGLEIVPVGLTFRAWREGRPWPDPSPLPPVLAGEDDPRVPKDHLTQNLIGQFHYMKGVTMEPRDWLQAEKEFRRAAEAAPDNDVLFYNLGLIYRRNGLLTDSLEWFRRSHAINPRHLASHDRPRASSKMAELKGEIDQEIEAERSLFGNASLSGFERGSTEWHLGMAALLRAGGQATWARGHELRALGAGAPPP